MPVYDPGGNTYGGNFVSYFELVEIAHGAGFRGNALITACAVAMAESEGNPYAHNTNAATGDNSYGLWQINMIGAIGPERRKRYGLRSNDDLFQVAINARVAYGESKGGRDWTPW